MGLVTCRVFSAVVLGFLLCFANTSLAAKLSGDDLREKSFGSDEMGRFAGSTLLLARNVVIKSGEGAQAVPAFTTKLPVGRNGARILVQTVRVSVGRVDAVLGSSELERGVLLQGPNKTLGITSGGRLSMIVTNKNIIVAALSGDALLGRDGKFKPLREGTVRFFSRTSGVSRDVAMPRAPSLTSEAGLSVALEGEARLSLRVGGKSTSRVVVSDSSGAQISEVVVSKPGRVEVAIPRAGTYFAQSRALGPGGIESALSERLKLQVLGLAPGQAPSRNGVFFLDRGERVRLAGTEGLEVRYGRSTEFFPAGRSLGLSQRKATIVEFRHPQHPEQTAQLKLAPRVTDAQIYMGPARAVWPGKPLTLRVGVRDGTGKMMRLGSKQKVHVTVNAKKKKLRWKHTTKGMVARLPPQAGPGPWVVRMSVYDGKGRTLARDFLEVSER